MPNSEGKKSSFGKIKTTQKRKRKPKYAMMDAPGIESIKGSESTQEEKSQREGEEKFRNFLDNLGDIAYEADTSGNVTYANKMAEKITGIPLKDIIGKAFLPLFTKESQQTAIDVYERTLNGEGSEYELTFINGRICHFKNEPLRDDNGKITGVFGIARDVTERKQVKKALRVSEERFRMMLENLPNVAVQGYAPDGTIHYWNKANESIYGYTAEEAIGKDLVELIIPPEMRDNVREAISHGACTGEMPAAAELNLMRKDGSHVPVWSSHAVVRHAGKEPELFCIDVDLSELKRTEKALRESEERFKNLFNNALLGLYRTTPDGRILMANPALVRMLGYNSFEELASRNLEEEGFEPEYFRSNFKERIETDGRVIGLEADWKRLDGTILPIRESARAIRDEHGNILYYEGTVEDISERKRAEDELRRHRDHLEEMVATRTHELERSNEVLQAEIAERKQTEEALKMSELRFRSLIEQTTDGVFCYEYDPPIPINLPVEQQVRLLYDGVLIECNDVCAKSYGANRSEEVIGKRLTELFRTMPGSLDELFTEMIDGGYRTVDVESVERLEEGTERYYLNNGHGVIEDGSLIRVWGTFREITGRKRADQALRESEEKFRSLADQSPNMIFINIKGRVVYANKKCEEIIGYTKEELCSPDFDFRTLVAPESMNLINDNFARHLRGEEVQPYDYSIIKKDGKRIEAINASKLIHYEGDTAILGVVTDITERKKAEKALRESEQKYRSFLRHFMGIAYRGNIETWTPLFFHGAVEEITGYKEDEFLDGKPRWDEVIHPDDFYRMSIDGSVKKMCSVPDFTNKREYRIVRKDGQIRWVHEMFRNLSSESGKPVIVEGCIYDVTERKRVEQALRESEERLKILFESAPDAIYLIDSEGRFVDGNRAALKLIGFARDEVIGKSLAEVDLLSAGQLTKAEANLKKVVTGKLSGPNEYTLKRKDGSYVSVEVRTFPVKIGGKMLTLGIARDITEHKRTEKELLEHQAKLKSLASQLSLTEERERHRLATDLHDQISQSLVISKIKLDQLRKSSGSDEFNKSLKDISNCLGQAIDDTRALTFDLSYPILYELGFEAAVAEWLTDQIQVKHGIETEFVDDRRQKPLDDNIRVLLFRNVRELLINVVKHAKASKIKVTIRKVKNNISVGVEDDGIGFDPAEVMSMAAKRAEFGLFSVRERLEQLGGLIEIDSGTGRGSKIRMTAPLKNRDAIAKV